MRGDACGQLVRRRRVHGRKQAWFLFNERDQAVETAVGLEGARRVRDLLDQPLSRDGDRLTLRVEPSDVRCLVLEA